VAHLDQWIIGTNPEELSSSRSRIFTATGNRELMLAANEILSNGIEHSGQEQHVAISNNQHSFTLTISGSGTKRGMHMRPSGERGRGLQLVQALVDRLITTSTGGILINTLVVYR